MKKHTVYGLPLNPMPALEQLKGSSFCVSYGTRAKLGKQLDQAISLVGKDQILLVDNGAFSAWEAGVNTMSDDTYLEGFAEWANDILDRSDQAVAVLPDVIDGDEQQNWQLILETMGMFPNDRVMPVWHMHESISYLIHLVESFSYVGIGSSAQYRNFKKPNWTARINEAFAAIAQWEKETGEVRPRIHMLRAQSKHHLFDFDSSDSVNVAMNHNRQRVKKGETITAFAARINNAIQASAGPEAPHQIAQPLDWHVQSYNEDLARATAPGATELDVWMFNYRHGELPKTPAQEERELVALLTSAGYAVSVADAPAQMELPLAA
jgi:hypothetical protein